MIEEGLFSDSASRDWAGSLVKLLKEQTEKTKQMSELQKMKTEQKKIEQSKQSTLTSFIKKRNEIMLLMSCCCKHQNTMYKQS